MTHVKHVSTTATRRALSLATGLLMLAGLSVGYAGPIGAAPATEPVELLTRKVNEYEGQHRLAVAGDPSQWGLASGKDPEFPVTPNLTRKVNEYEGQHRLAAERGEGLDTGLLTRKVNEYEGQHR
jgi:hypothetical protein